MPTGFLFFKPDQFSSSGKLTELRIQLRLTTLYTLQDKMSPFLKSMIGTKAIKSGN